MPSAKPTVAGTWSRVASTLLVFLLMVPALPAQIAAVVQVQQRNKAVIERYFHEVLDGHKFEVVREIFSDDATQQFPGLPTVKGAALIESGLNRALGDTTFQTKILNLVAEGDLVFARIEHTVKYKEGSVRRNPAGVTPEFLPIRNAHWVAMSMFRMAGGKIVEEWISRDDLGVLTQIGTVTVVPKVTR
jgi:predicted SnoaL-like aldol condensation-catalyzing enzyme